tara:strand:- start:274 stop:2259 length:1986 start_codon:yes stop_codon:yes gene_type:complete
MKKNLTFILFFFAIITSIAQDNKRGLNIQLMEDRSRRPATENDSILSASIDNNISKNTDAKIQDYLIISSEMDTIIVDTSLTICKYYKMNYLRKDNFHLLPFSNSGLAYNELTFVSKKNFQSDIGAKNKKNFYHSADDINYYHVPTPFTELMYRSVFVQGQLLDALYTVNTSKRYNFSISRKGLRSLGNYQNFISNPAIFTLTSNYSSKSKKYNSRFHYSKQELFAEQNGGISDNDILNFESGDEQFIDRGVFDPQFENASNQFSSKRFFLDHIYYFNKTDSLSKSSYSLRHIFSYEEQENRFDQNSPNNFFGETFTSEKISDKILLNSIKTRFIFSFDQNLIGDFEIGTEFIQDKYFLENFQTEIFADDERKISSETGFLLLNYSKQMSALKFDFFSSNKIFGDNDYMLIGSDIHLELNKKNSIVFKLLSIKYAPAYNATLFASNYLNYNWSNDLDFIESNQFSLLLNFPKILDVNIDYHSLNNFVQFEKTNLSTTSTEEVYRIRPVQYNEKIDFYRINLNKKITLGKFTLDSRFMYQKYSDENKISYPEIVARNSVFFSTEMFKKALFLQTGFSFKYFSSYYMKGYDPILSELYVQNDRKYGEFPLIDFFINAKIQQTRLFLKFEHLNSSLTGYNYYSAPNYPYRDFVIRFGLVWNFFL